MGQYLELAKQAAAKLAAGHEPTGGKTAPRRVPGPGEVLILEPGHRLATFDWDAPGFDPCESPRIINGIRHKRNDCTSRRAWRHVWGDVLCLDCWPPTDPKAVMAPINTQATMSTTIDSSTGKSSGFAQIEVMRSFAGGNKGEEAR